VAIAMARSADAIVATLGTLAAGAVCVPIDLSELGPERTAATGRLAAIVGDARPGVVIVDETTKAAIPDARRVRVFGEVMTSDDPGDGALPADPIADAPALLVYESTSRGVLRRVAIAHRALVRPVHPSIRLQPSDRVAHVSHAFSGRSRFE